MRGIIILGIVIVVLLGASIGAAFLFTDNTEDCLWVLGAGVVVGILVPGGPRE